MPEPAVHDAPVPLMVVAQSEEFVSVTWLESRLVVQYRPPAGTQIWHERLGVVSLDDEPVRPLTLPDAPAPPCTERTGFQSPARLPDGRLRYLARCTPVDVRAERQLYLLAYDPVTEQVQPLHPGPLRAPDGTPWTNVGDYSFNPDMTSAIATDGQQLTGQLYWLTSTGTAHLDVGADNVRDVAWSPDGQTIAYTAAQAGLFRGADRVQARYTLYLMDASGQQQRALVQGFQFRAGIAWSPDSRWLVLTGDFGDTDSVGGSGLWLVDGQTGDRWRLAEGSFSSPSWEPSGSRIAAIRHRPNPDAVVVLDLAEVLETATP